MSDLFHFTHHTRHVKTPISFEVGTVLRTADRRSNPYFESAREYHHELPVLGVPQPVSRVLRSKSVQAFSPEEIAANCALIIESHFKAIREYEFEEIRRFEFPDLPSRMRCLWLTDLDGARHWNKRLDGRVNPRLLRVSVRGITHAANEGHLSVEVQSLAILRDAARSYWRGDGHPEGRTEVLLEGEMSVLEVMDPQAL